MGGGGPVLGEEDVHRLLGAQVEVPADVLILLGVGGADEEHGQIRGQPLEADSQVRQLLPVISQHYTVGRPLSRDVSFCQLLPDYDIKMQT